MKPRELARRSPQLRRAVEKVRALQGRRGEPEPVAPSATIPGVVEEFDNVHIRGWITVPASARPVRVSLYVNQHELAYTYATSASGGQAADVDPDELAAAAPHARPKQFKRHGWKEIRPFHLRLLDLWTYTRRGHKVSVRVDGQPLPISGIGMYKIPARNGTRPFDELLHKLKNGYVFAQWGKLQLSKSLDVQWQAQVMGLYQDVRVVLAEKFDYDAFFVYGTLLGAVREGGFIGHDIDFDCAYLSRHTDGLAAAREVHDVALALIEAGFDVEINSVSLHVHLKQDPDVRIDVFYLYFDENGAIAFPFGIAGTSRFTRDDWAGLRDFELPAGEGRIPVAAEKLVEHIYGNSWREPKPGFNWRVDRTTAAYSSRVPADLMADVYWTNHWTHAPAAEPSEFSAWLLGRAGLPSTVLDLGCGDGADVAAYAAAGRDARGADWSALAVARAAARGAGRFETCDLRSPAAVRALLGSVGHPVTVTLRRVLDIVAPAVADDVLVALAESATAGDVLAVEFRAAPVAKRPDIRGERAVDPAEFVDRLRSSGWTIVAEDERDGMHRVLAKRS